MFGTAKYETLLNSFLRNGFNLSLDWSAPSHRKHVLLRHDVDFSISNALQIARVEHSLGVSATYYFMLTSNMYNLMSEHSINLVKEIQSLGHAISLHFDPTASGGLKSFPQQKLLFEHLFDTQIDFVSIHRPGPFLENNNANLYGCSHTYQDRYFKLMTYISDSAGKDIEKDIENYVSNPNEAGLQLLTHPIWWTSINETPTITLTSHLNNMTEFLSNEIAKNCRTYRP